ncbi:MAG: hypothetical protein H0Z24_03175 [Thermosipho sp. (in: Bacteria)]|nr:hypothetical protein [Thermosipho sp. (in: thermotogales)]
MSGVKTGYFEAESSKPSCDFRVFLVLLGNPSFEVFYITKYAMTTMFVFGKVPDAVQFMVEVIIKVPIT